MRMKVVRSITSMNVKRDEHKGNCIIQIIYFRVEVNWGWFSSIFIAKWVSGKLFGFLKNIEVWVVSSLPDHMTICNEWECNSVMVSVISTELFRSSFLYSEWGVSQKSILSVMYNVQSQLLPVLISSSFYARNYLGEVLHV